MLVKLPGLIDPHVHVRDPGSTHKEDWDSASAAALAGGITTILAMPNTQPQVTDEGSLEVALKAAKSKARCDYAQYLGATDRNTEKIATIGESAAGLKMYLNQTYGPLQIKHISTWMSVFEKWPKKAPIVAHAEGSTMAGVILMAALYDRPVHIAHVSTREEILLIRSAREKGIQVTCEVTPHHLFLTASEAATLMGGRKCVLPPLATRKDVAFLWENLNVIDCFASDHAPHTLQEKDGPNPPPGFPGLETSLPLYLNAVNEGRLEIDDLVARMYTNPREIFRIPAQPDTWIEVDMGQESVIEARHSHTRCGWTPFEGWKVRGSLQQVILRGQEVFKEGQVLAKTGFGKNIRE